MTNVAIHSAHKKNFATPEHFAGIVAGESVSEKFLLKLIDFEEELAAVTSPKILGALAEKNISAINFSEVIE
ncbi:MAG: hypothetical protein IJG80_09920 [Selenomonadaceae bacterium]|nr:hypothetical protein [Selenomonadaceae bacterium]MBQ9498102.1 hypothetical protein [Selenomonadaceae bacterium]